MKTNLNANQASSTGNQNITASNNDESRPLNDQQSLTRTGTDQPARVQNVTQATTRLRAVNLGGNRFQGTAQVRDQAPRLPVRRQSSDNSLSANAGQAPASVPPSTNANSRTVRFATENQVMQFYSHRPAERAGLHRNAPTPTNRLEFLQAELKRLNSLNKLVEVASRIENLENRISQLSEKQNQLESDQLAANKKYIESQDLGMLPSLQSGTDKISQIRKEINSLEKKLKDQEEESYELTEELGPSLTGTEHKNEIEGMIEKVQAQIELEMSPSSADQLDTNDEPDTGEDHEFWGDGDKKPAAKKQPPKSE